MDSSPPVFYCEFLKNSYKGPGNMTTSYLSLRRVSRHVFYALVARRRYQQSKTASKSALLFMTSLSSPLPPSSIPEEISLPSNRSTTSCLTQTVYLHDADSTLIVFLPPILFLLSQQNFLCKNSSTFFNVFTRRFIDSALCQR